MLNAGIAIMARPLLTLLLCGWALGLLGVMTPARAAPPNSSALGCATHQCNLHADGPYPNYVIGVLVHVGTNAEMKQVFQWAKHHDYWQALPDSPAPYVKHVKLVTIRLPPSLAERPVTVFMQQEEFTSAPLSVGDLVRYRPHGRKPGVPLNAPKKAALYHGLTGCVATLCRQSDPACYKRYRQGVFTKTQGRQVNLHTGAVIPDGLRINPVSMLPIPAAERNQH